MANKFHYDFTSYLYLQRVAPKTRESYLRAVRDISIYHDQPAEQLDNHQIQEFLHYCITEKQLYWSTCNVLFCALKKYYREFLGRDESQFTIPSRPRDQKLPMLLSMEEVSRIINAPGNLKHRTLLTMVYGSGLRVSEVVKLRPEHIESSRMMLRVEQGKGRKDRYTVLSQTGLDLLRDYWREYRPERWLFPGKNSANYLSISSVQRVYHQAKEKAGVTRGRGIHTLRHCFATHSLDQGVDLVTIKRWLGHSSIKTTCRYLHTSPEQISRVRSPLDTLAGEIQA